MKHDPQLTKAPARDESATRELAACYARLFLGTDDGKRVLADLCQRYDSGAPIFEPNPAGDFDPLRAAMADGKRQVLIFIRGAINLGAPRQGLTNP